MRQHHRVVVHVDDPAGRVDRLREIAAGLGAGQAGADVDELPDARLEREKSHRALMEGEDSGTGTVNCSGSLSLDLPPGVAVVGGRRSLSADIDYTLQRAADGSGDVVLVRNADAIITPLATLARVAEPAQQAAPPPTAATDPLAPAPEAGTAAPTAAAPTAQEPRPAQMRPSFNCGAARTRP